MEAILQRPRQQDVERLEKPHFDIGVRHQRTQGGTLCALEVVEDSIEEEAHRHAAIGCLEEGGVEDVARDPVMDGVVGQVYGGGGMLDQVDAGDRRIDAVLDHQRLVHADPFAEEALRIDCLCIAVIASMVEEDKHPTHHQVEDKEGEKHHEYTLSKRREPPQVHQLHASNIEQEWREGKRHRAPGGSTGPWTLCRQKKFFDYTHKNENIHLCSKELDSCRNLILELIVQTYRKLRFLVINIL